MDLSLLGETTAKLMDDCEHAWDDTVELVAVGIVVVVDAGDQSFTRTYSSRVLHFENIGLFTNALDCIRDGDDGRDE